MAPMRHFASPLTTASLAAALAVLAPSHALGATDASDTSPSDVTSDAAADTAPIDAATPDASDAMPFDSDGSDVHDVTRDSATDAADAEAPDVDPRDARIVEFTLVRADNGEAIEVYDPIPPNVQLNLGRLPTRKLNIRAQTSPSKVGSVRFDLGNTLAIEIDNEPPYSIAESEWAVPSDETTSLRATPFSKSGADGTRGHLSRLPLNIVDEPSQNARPAVIVEAPERGFVRTAPAYFDVRVKAGDIDGSVERVDIAVSEGPTARAEFRDGRWHARVGPVGEGIRMIKAFARDDAGDLGSAATRVRVRPGPGDTAPPPEDVAIDTGRDADDATLDTDAESTGDTTGTPHDMGVPPPETDDGCRCQHRPGSPVPLSLIACSFLLVAGTRMRRIYTS